MKIHNGDTVTVISGKDKSVTGKVLSVDHKKGTLVVEGVNLAYKHVKPSQKNPHRPALIPIVPDLLYVLHVSVTGTFQHHSYQK